MKLSADLIMFFDLFFLFLKSDIYVWRVYALLLMAQ